MELRRSKSDSDVFKRRFELTEMSIVGDKPRVKTTTTNHTVELLPHSLEVLPNDIAPAPSAEDGNECHGCCGDSLSEPASVPSTEDELTSIPAPVGDVQPNLDKPTGWGFEALELGTAEWLLQFYSITDTIVAAYIDVVAEASLSLNKLHAPAARCRATGATPICSICFDPLTEAEMGKQPCARRTCGTRMCGGCAAAYFSTTVKSSLYSCPVLRCAGPDCGAPIPVAVWTGFVEANIVELYEANAMALAVIRCEDCDEQYSLLCPAAQGDSERDAAQAVLMDCLKSAGSEGFVIGMLAEYEARERSAASVLDEMEKHLRNGELAEVIMAPATEGAPLLQLVADVERRTTLLMEHLRRNPLIETPCCGSAMCFRCKCMGHHEGETCEERALEEIGDGEVNCCPVCGVPTVKVEGCEHIICVCGANWDWATGEALDGDDY